VCASDPNAGARRAAQERINEKNYKYGANSVKYWNRETSFKRGRERAGMGLSKTQSDVKQQVLNAIGKARGLQEATETARAKEVQGATAYGMGESGDRKRARSEVLEFLAKHKAVDAQLRDLPRQQDAGNRAAKLQYLSIRAKNREALGAKPDWGAPVTMPPRDTAGQILQTGMNALSIASSVATFGASGLGQNLLTKTGLGGVASFFNKPT
jgi:hypothetical protein